VSIRAGTMLAGRYRVIRPIGAGGMGEVYEAEQVSLGRRVAVKVLFDDEEKALARFDHEARAMAKLAHPHVVAVIDFHRDAERPLLVMELLEGESLHRVLEREGTLSPARSIRIALEMLEALMAAHRAGIVHRDVKPSNVFLWRDPRGGETVKLLDFGLAKAEGGPRTTAGVVVGTASYLAPEQLLGDPPDPRVDLRAVGLCLYEMLAGRKPWRSSGRYDLASEIVSKEPLTFAELGAPIDRELAAVVERSVAREKSARFPDAPSMIAALSALAASASARAVPLATIVAPPREPTLPTEIVAAPRGPHDVTGISPVRVAATVSMPSASAPTTAMPSSEARVSNASPPPLPIGVLVALGAVVVAAIAGVFVYEVFYAKAAPEPTPAPVAIGTQPPARGTFSTVPQMIKAHAYGETVDGAGCTCYPLEVMKDPTRAPLECASCRDQRVRGSGRCVGDDVTGKRLPGVYLCRQIMGLKP
jgi:eukaryotic-like serine/threonine-protein kinase